MNALGIEVVDVSQNRVVATMPVSDSTRQPFGYLHGGASVALAETAASIGAFQNIDQSSQSVMALEINANFIASKRDGIVTAVAAPLHIGKTTMVWEIKISDESGKLICVSRCTIGIVARC